MRHAPADYHNYVATTTQVPDPSSVFNAKSKLHAEKQRSPWLPGDVPAGTARHSQADTNGDFRVQYKRISKRCEADSRSPQSARPEA